MRDLDFIKDKELRKTLEDAIEYIYALFDQSKKYEQNQLYLEETYRVIILYTLSAIEAILLYFYKARGEKLEHPEYKFVCPLPPEYAHSSKPSFAVVVAVQEMVEKQEHQLGIGELVAFFKKRNLILEKTAKSILDMNDVRNTFHFNKHRAQTCDLDRVEKALQLLVHTIKNAPKTLETK